MEGLPPDLGKIVAPGYYNANPPGNPQFALTAGDSGLATSIGQSGGLVSVDPVGGINMQTSSTSFIGLDSFNNISIVTQNIEPNATIDMLGQSTITVSSADGQVKLESVVNDSYITLDLDLTLEARGALLGGGNVNISNAGTFAFDTLGPAAITGLSTINGSAYVPGGGSISSLDNRLQIVATATGQTVSTITYSGGSGVGSPSAFIPDNTTFLPVSGGQNNGWRCTKQVGTSGTSTKIAWYQYNPNYGLSTPYTVDPSPAFTKQQLKSVYAIIYTKNRITTQGQIFFNIFTYDVASPPATQTAWTTRFDYSIGQYATALGTGTTALTTQTLVGGYRYLICCVDTPKIVQQTTATVAGQALVIGTEYTISIVGNAIWTSVGAAVNTIGCVFTATGTSAGGTTGSATFEVNTVASAGTILTSGVQTPGQTGFLRDPYDIHTDIPHVPFNAGLIVTGGNTQPVDISAVPVIAIAVSTNSGTVPVTADFTVEAIGFSADNGSGTANFEYTLQYS